MDANSKNLGGQPIMTVALINLHPGCRQTNVRRRAGKQEEMAKIRRRTMKLAAIIYAANLLVNIIGAGATSDLFNSKEEEAFFTEELHSIADRIMPNICAPSLDHCISEAIRRS